MKREDFIDPVVAKRNEALSLAMQDKSSNGGSVELVKGKVYGLATLQEAMAGLAAKPMPLNVENLNGRPPRYWVYALQDGDSFIGLPFSYFTARTTTVNKDSNMPEKCPNWDANGQANPNDKVDAILPGGAIAQCMQALRGRTIHEMVCGLAEWCERHGVVSVYVSDVQHVHQTDFNDRKRTAPRTVYYLAAVNAQGQVVAWDGQVPDTAKYVNGTAAASQPVQQPPIQQQPAGPAFGQPVVNPQQPQGPIFGQ